MSINRPEGQQNPEEAVELAAVDFRAQVVRRVQALEEHRGAIVRWFWRALLALNLVLWSLASVIAFLLYVA